jgi:predicted nucleic acid-binding protein
MRKVLDSWALLAWLQGEEPAARKVRKLLDRAEAGQTDLAMSMMNVGEVFYMLAKRQGEQTAEAFLRDLQGMPIRTRMPTERDVLDAARLKGRLAISYADAFAVETARQLNAELVTGDPELKAVADAGLVELDWLGR